MSVGLIKKMNPLPIIWLIWVCLIFKAIEIPFPQFEKYEWIVFMNAWSYAFVIYYSHSKELDEGLRKILPIYRWVD